MTDDELREELTSLADDFDSLSDDARDDMLFIYDWEAPVWMNGYGLRVFDVLSYPGRERAVVVAAVLREAIKRLSPADEKFEKFPPFIVGPSGKRW